MNLSRRETRRFEGGFSEKHGGSSDINKSLRSKEVLACMQGSILISTLSSNLFQPLHEIEWTNRTDSERLRIVEPNAKLRINLQAKNLAGFIETSNKRVIKLVSARPKCPKFGNSIRLIITKPNNIHDTAEGLCKDWVRSMGLSMEELNQPLGTCKRAIPPQCFDDGTLDFLQGCFGNF